MKVPYWMTKEYNDRLQKKWDNFFNIFRPSNMNTTQKILLLVLIAITLFQFIYYDSRESYLSDLVEMILVVLIPVCITAIYIFKD